jgi:HAD superfamily hydrolase (TIGR01509 family)
MSGEDEMLEIDKTTLSRECTDQVFKDMLDYAYCEFEKHNVELKAGAIELLDYCQDNHLQIGLATSTYETRARETLEKLGLLSYFDFLVFGDEVDIPKPDPMIYHLAVERSGIGHDNCLVVEDSLSGVLSARKAKLSVVQIFDDVDPVDLADYNVDALSGIMPIIDQLVPEHV